MHGRSTRSFAGPREGSVGETDAPSRLEDRAEQRRHGLALSDVVGRDEREPARDFAEEVERFAVPAGDVIEPADVLALPHVAQLLRLLGGASGVTQEWWVAHNHSIGIGSEKVRPVGA